MSLNNDGCVKDLDRYRPVLVVVVSSCIVSFSQAAGEEVTGEQLHEILREIDTNMNGQVELDEYLQVSISACLSLTYKFIQFIVECIFPIQKGQDIT